MRVFVAVDCSGPVRTAVAGAAADLRRVAPGADVRWVAPEALHLTLRFLGDVAEARVAEIRVALGPVARAARPLVLEAVGLGSFPTLRRPRVVWVGVGGDTASLGALVAAVEDVLEPLEFARETRPFQPHMTIGRVRSGRGLAPLVAAIEAGRQRHLGAWEVPALVLYRSRLGPGGAVHEPLATLALGVGDA